MSLGRSSRFCFLGLAKVKSEKVLSSFASASSITTHHGSSCVARILDTEIGKPWWIWKCSNSWEHAQVLGLIVSINCIVLLVSSAMLWPFQIVNSLSVVGFFPSYQNHSQHLHFVPSLHRQCAILPWVPSISGVSKFIHYVVLNKVIHIIHSSLGMPSLRTPPNVCCGLP